MNRRAFLGTLAAAAVGLAIDPAILLSAPPSTTFTSTCALTAGDVFTITGVYAVNPLTLRCTSFLQTFVVMADVEAGEIPLTTICPRPIADGPYRTVSATWAED